MAFAVLDEDAGNAMHMTKNIGYDIFYTTNSLHVYSTYETLTIIPLWWGEFVLAAATCTTVKVNSAFLSFVSPLSSSLTNLRSSEGYRIMLSCVQIHI